MHSADSGTHLSQRREKLLHFLRIPHDHRKRYRANVLHSAERFGLRASPRTSAPHRRPPSLRKPFQKIRLSIPGLRFTVKICDTVSKKCPAAPLLVPSSQSSKTTATVWASQTSPRSSNLSRKSSASRWSNSTKPSRCATPAFASPSSSSALLTSKISQMPPPAASCP